MSLDIGEAFGEGLSRLTTASGLSLAVAFVAVALVSAVLTQTLLVEGFEALLEFYRGLSPEQLDASQGEYDRQVSVLETQLEATRESSPLALEVPISVAAGGLLAVAILAEAVSVVAVRVFAAEEGETSPAGATAGLLSATLNGFVGGIVVWGLIIAGSVVFLLPGLFFAVAFYFLRQEIALEDRNFVEAMAESWRLTRGNRLTVFALGLLVVVVSQFEAVVSFALARVSPLAAALVSPVAGGVLAAFGAAVVTRAYLQLRDPEVDEETTADPYDAALGPDDIPE
jgi:hypothetical protein